MKYIVKIIFNNDISARYIQITYRDSNNKVKIAFFAALGNWIGDALLFPLDTISTRLKAYKF
jgi:hypothetical protein